MATENSGFTASDDLAAFHRFVGEKIKNGGARLTPEEALDEWRLEHPSLEELANSVAAVKIALSEADSGQGQPLNHVIAEIRQKYKLPPAVPEE